MNKSKKFILSMVVLLTITGLVGGMLIPVPARAASIQPELKQLALEMPDKVISVIAQKADTTQSAEKLVVKLGGVVTKDLHIINAFAAQLSAQSAFKLSQSKAVRWISLDRQVSVSWGDDDDNVPLYERTHYLDTTNSDRAQYHGYSGDGIGVAIIDSGIDASHGCLNVAGAPFGSGDQYGHGTHVAGIIACNDYYYGGMAPDAILYDLKIFDSDGNAFESDVVAALEWIYNNHAQYNIRVVNMSLNTGYEASYHESFMNAAAELLWFNGVVVVVSAGNKGPMGGANTVSTAPANDPFFIAVGASDEHDDSDLSNDEYAPFAAAGVSKDGYLRPDVVAPGYNIYSALSSESSWGIDYPERVVTRDGKDFIRMSGTSMSTPMVTGAVAQLLDRSPELNPDQVKYLMMNHGDVVYKDREFKFRYLQVDDAMIAASYSTPTANTGLYPSKMLFTGDADAWNSVAWNSVAWNSVAWNSVAWNSVAWNSVAWNSVAWNSVSLDSGIYWGHTRGPNK